jgi:hypothetical protein
MTPNLAMTCYYLCRMSWLLATQRQAGAPHVILSEAKEPKPGSCPFASLRMTADTRTGARPPRGAAKSG